MKTTLKLLVFALALIIPITLVGRDHSCCRGHGHGGYWGGFGVSVGYGPMAYYNYAPPQYLSSGPYPTWGWGW